MIPKKIHYCWFGNGDKPAIFQKCLESWKKYCPDYEIIEWNEQNVDLEFCNFVKCAYINKKWAFVSDVIRLKVIFEQGGIYLDTDVELYESLDDLIDLDAFLFFQNYNQINTGLGFGAEKGNRLIEKMLDDYKSLDFSIGSMNRLACPIRNTDIVCKEVKYFQANNITQKLDNIAYISFDDYCARAHHYGEFSWMSEEQKKLYRFSKKKHTFWKVRKVLRDSRIITFFEKNNLFRIKRIYTFIVYDLIDYGVLYWLMRVIYKIKR